MNEKSSTPSCGFVALLGPPNAGKSTLMNRLIGEKISIVTPKAQTTRARVRGVCAEGQAQLVFIDTPGIFAAKKRFEQGMVQEAWAGAADADALLVLIDAQKGLDEEAEALLTTLASRKNPPAFLAFNKVDAVRKPYLLALIAALTRLLEQLGAPNLFERIFMISALKRDGLAEMKTHLAARMPEGPWLYPEDELTDQPMRTLAAEVTREKLFLLLRQELPYSLTVETESWEEDAGRLRISQAITVEREAQKKIVIGAGGGTLKRVGESARREMEKMLGRSLHLQLFVKVDEKWKDRAGGQ